jgi:hypothetical protein
MSYTTIVEIQTNMNHFANNEEYKAFIETLGLYSLATEIGKPFVDSGQLQSVGTNVVDNVVTVTRVWDNPQSSEQFNGQIAARQAEFDQILSGLGWTWSYIQS